MDRWVFGERSGRGGCSFFSFLLGHGDVFWVYVMIFSGAMERGRRFINGWREIFDSAVLERH
ncbi:hypothetical protein I7I48_09546 [Histoplasma ohiense]|nr:hypothetical protein I7I48_09546 [Histoplasma ohiense (nom. inval.)]